jgi:DNA-binding MarR family transcriptional regulator
MIAVFNPDQQVADKDSRIVAALIRLSEALKALQWKEATAGGLSPVQVQILIFLFHHSESKRTVSYIADEFSISRPTVSDAIKALMAKGLVEKKTGGKDKRSQSLALTTKGIAAAEAAANYTNALKAPLDKLGFMQKDVLLITLTELVHQLHRGGVLINQRMCFGCKYYSSIQKPHKHFCRLLKTGIDDTDIRIDCHDYEAN